MLPTGAPGVEARARRLRRPRRLRLRRHAGVGSVVVGRLRHVRSRESTRCDLRRASPCGSATTRAGARARSRTSPERGEARGRAPSAAATAAAEVVDDALAAAVGRLRARRALSPRMLPLRMCRGRSSTCGASFGIDALEQHARRRAVPCVTIIGLMTNGATADDARHRLHLLHHLAVLAKVARVLEDEHVRVDAEHLLAKLRAEAAGDADDGRERRDTERDAEDREHRPDRDERPLLRAHVAKRERERETHGVLGGPAIEDHARRRGGRSTTSPRDEPGRSAPARRPVRRCESVQSLRGSLPMPLHARRGLRAEVLLRRARGSERCPGVSLASIGGFWHEKLSTTFAYLRGPSTRFFGSYDEGFGMTEAKNRPSSGGARLAPGPAPITGPRLATTPDGSAGSGSRNHAGARRRDAPPRRHRSRPARSRSPTSKRRAATGATPTSAHVIDGRYKVETVLGEGGMGVVYRCTPHDHRQEGSRSRSCAPTSRATARSPSAS